MNYDETLRGIIELLDGYAPKRNSNTPNFMTPDIVKTFKIGKKKIEVSMGTGFSGAPIIGVTVVGDHESSELVHSVEELETKLATL